jgi:amino acid transporter
MSTKTKIAFFCYLIAILVIASIAVIYLGTPQLLPYQEQAISVPWTELSPEVQTQFLSLLKVSGGGYLMTAIALAVMLFIPFRRREPWTRWAIPSIGIIGVAIVNYAGIMVRANTPGEPPLIAGPVVYVLMAVGFFLSYKIED